MGIFSRTVEMKNTISMLLYGVSGVGKTTLAISAKNPVVLDFEKGLCRVKEEYQNAPSLQVQSYKQVVEALNSDDIKEFDTVIIDSVDEMTNSITTYLMDKNPKLKRGTCLSLQGYGELKGEFRSFMNALKRLNKNIIFVAHEKQEKDGEDIFIRPDLGAGSGGAEIIKWLDVIGYMKHTGKDRVICFEAENDKFMTKNSLDLDRSIKLTDLNGANQNDFIQKVIEPALEHKIKAVKERQAFYSRLHDEVQGMIDGIIDADSCNFVYQKLQDVKYSQYKMWKTMLLDKTKELNLVFNQETRKFACC